MEEPLELPLLCNLLVQQHIRKFHSGQETLWLHVWKLSSDSFARLTFKRGLQRLLLQISEDRQHVSARESGLDSSTGVIERISLHGRPLFHRWKSSFLHLQKELKLLVSGVKDY